MAVPPGQGLADHSSSNSQGLIRQQAVVEFKTLTFGSYHDVIQQWL
jgi:hypothetical protein